MEALTGSVAVAGALPNGTKLPQQTKKREPEVW